MILSVVIPTCHRNPELARCLERLAPGAQTIAAGHYEVFVTDDGRGNHAEALIRARFPWAHWMAGPRRGPAANRNYGAKRARGEWLVFVDDDCEPDHEWLKAIAGAAKDGSWDVIEGQTEIPDKTDNPFRQGVENLHGGVYWSCNLAVRREVFNKLGGFDEDFQEACCEDMELAWRISHQQWRTHFLKSAIVYHPTRRLNWQAIIRRTGMIRWLSLYHLKTHHGPALTAWWPRVLLWLATSRFLNLLRSSWKYARHFDVSKWRTQGFWWLWDWVTFPIVLPYICMWELHFRRQLNNRKMG